MFKPPKTILITGCAGFIGSAFLKKFKEKFPETDIAGIDDFSTGRRDAFDPAGIRFYEGSILDGDLLDKIFAKHRPEYVFHFAALPRVSFSVEHPYLTDRVNAGGTVLLLEKSRKFKIKKFVFSSSSAVYGRAGNFPTEENNELHPLSPYAAQKISGERYCRLFSELYGLDTVSLRYFNVYGPGQYGDSPYSTVIAAWLESLYFPGRKKGFIEGDGTQSRDFCFIADVVNANILAMESDKPLSGAAINIAGGYAISINEVGKKIESFTGKKLNLVNCPPRIGDAPRTVADISRAGALLNYRPETKFDDGLKQTIQWFESRGKS